MSKKLSILKVVLVMLVIFSVHHKSFAGKSVPEYIRKLVFEESDFSQPVTLRLPCEEEDYIMSGLSEPSYL